MKKTQGSSFPAISRLQGAILVPYNVKQIEGEEGPYYEYGIHRHADNVPVTNFPYWQGVVWRLLQSDLHKHVYGTYDQGEQATFLAYATRAQQEGREDIYAECFPVQQWIDDVLSYYDARKVAVFAAQDETELLSVNWDFAGDKPCVDRKDWRTLRAMFDE